MSRDMTPEKGIFKFVLLLALVIVIAFGFFIFKQPLSPRIDILTHSVGELERDIGNNMRLAGDTEDAIKQYQFALEHTRFEGPQNRAEVEEHLGALLVVQGDYDDALPHLQSAAQGPYRRVGAYRPWVLALEALEDWDAIASLLPEWQALAQAQENTEAEAAALEAMARQAQRNGDADGYGEYLESAFAIAPGSPAGALLGRHLTAQGKYAEAVDVFDAWLWGGGRLYGGDVPQPEDGRLAATLEAWEAALKATAAVAVEPAE